MKRWMTGFTLVELAVAIAITGALSAGVLGVVSLSTQRANHVEAERTIHKVEDALITYARANGRLPCPDTTGTETAIGDGLQNCASPEASGQLPYRTIGLPNPPLDPWQRPLVYAVDTRLMLNPGHEYRYDFCQSLRANAEAGVSDTHLHSFQSGTARENLAYVLLSGGYRDTSDNESRIDQLQPYFNTRRFNVDDYGDQGVSDDQYAFASLYGFSSTLRCPGELVSTNAIENEIIAARLTLANLQLSVDTAQGNIDGVARQITMAGVQILIGSVNVAAAAASLINAIGMDLSGGGGSLSAAAAAAVAGAAAGVAAITAAAIDIDDAVSMKQQMEDRLQVLETFQQDAWNLCEGARLEVVSIKGDSESCGAEP